MKQFLKDKNRIVMLSLAVVFLLAVTTYAMTVDNFSDYDAPDYLSFQWADYMKDTGGVPTVNNVVSAFPRWSVEYPYRAIFIQGRMTSSNPKKYELTAIKVYSKIPSTDLFTFEYMAGEKNTMSGSKRGYIRAYINKDKVNGSEDDIRINFAANSPTPVYTLELGEMSFHSNYDVNYFSSGVNAYFDFDFFYDCADEHEQNARNLNISGLTSISGVPYKYIIHCKDHTGFTGGGGSSSGGSSSGSSSGGLSGDKNKGGDDGRHGWGTGDYGGGINKGDIVSGNDGGGYASRPDMELSVPDDWKKPIEDNYNSMPTEEYKPDYPEYIPGEGDTGQTGENWELPRFSDNDGVSGEIQGYKELIPNGEYGLIDFMKPWEEWFE